MKPILLIAIAGLVLSSCTNYGKKLQFKKDELYYTDRTTKEEAEKLGNYLVEQGFFTDNPDKRITAARQEWRYCLVQVRGPG